MLLPNSESCPDATKHRAYRAWIQTTNSRFFNRRLPLDQFGNSIQSGATPALNILTIGIQNGKKNKRNGERIISIFVEYFSDD